MCIWIRSIPGTKRRREGKAIFFIYFPARRRVHFQLAVQQITVQIRLLLFVPRCHFCSLRVFITRARSRAQMTTPAGSSPCFSTFVNTKTTKSVAFVARLRVFKSKTLRTRVSWLARPTDPARLTLARGSYSRDVAGQHPTG